MSYLWIKIMNDLLIVLNFNSHVIVNPTVQSMQAHHLDYFKNPCLLKVKFACRLERLFILVDHRRCRED